MAVRQEDVMSSMTSVIRKMDVMLGSMADTYEESVFLLGSMSNLTKISNIELKKQTKILSAIESITRSSSQKKQGPLIVKDVFKDFVMTVVNGIHDELKIHTDLLRSISGSKKGESKEGKSSTKVDTKEIGSLNKFISSLIKDVNSLKPDNTEKFISVINTITEKLETLSKKIKSKEIDFSVIDGVSKHISILFTGLIRYAFFAPFLLFGAKVFTSVLWMILYSIPPKPFALLQLYVLSSIGSGINSIVNVLLRSFIFAPLLKRGAKIFVEVIKMLLTLSDGISYKVSLLSIFYLKKISEIDIKTIVSSFSTGLISKIVGVVSGSMAKKAQDLKDSIRVILTISEGIPYQVGLLSIFYLNQISKINIKSIVESFTTSIFSKISSKITGSSLTKKSEDLKGAIRNILTVSEGISTKTALTSIIFIDRVSIGIGRFVKNFTLSAMLSGLILIGAKVISTSMSMILKSIEKIKTPKDAMQIGVFFYLISKSLFSFALGLSLIGIASPLILIGSLVLGLSLRILSKEFERIGESKNLKQGIKNTMAITLALSIFALVFVAWKSIKVTKEVVFSLIFGIGALVLISKIIGNNSENIQKGSKALALLSLSILGFSLVLMMIGSIPIDLGNLISITLSMLAFGFIFSIIGKKSSDINKGSSAIAWMSLSILAFTFILSVVSNIPINPIGVLIITASIALLGLVFYVIGKGWTTIMKGSLAVLTIGLSLLSIIYSLKMFKEIKMTPGDAALLGGILVGLGVVYGLAGAAIEFILPGAIAFAAIGVSLIIMAYALERFQRLNWSDSNTNILKNAITGVLEALSGTDKNKGLMSNIGSAVGRGLQAMVALLSIGPLILGSAAIWLMSEALEKFQSIKWADANTVSLGNVISTILDTLAHPSPGNTPNAPRGGSILDTILALMSSGALVFASASIWLMSEALIKFKTVNWNDTLTKTLTYTISQVLGVIENTGKGGFWSKLVGAGKASANATALGIASSAILDLSNALLKWETIKDPKAAGNNITSFINQMMDTFDPSKNTKIDAASGYIATFTGNITKISSTADQLSKVADNFDRMQKSMKLLKDHVNGFDLKKLSTTDSLIKSLAVLSKAPGDIAGVIGESINEALKSLEDTIKNISKDNSGNTGTPTPTSVAPLAPGPNLTATPPGPITPAIIPIKPGQPIPLTKEDLQAAFIAALQAVTVKTKVAVF